MRTCHQAWPVRRTRRHTAARGALRCLLGLPLLLGSGCALVSVNQGSPEAYQASRRGDVLTTGELSHATRNALSELGIETARCRAAPTPCIDALRDSSLLSADQRLSAMAEIALGQALQLDRASPRQAPPGLVGDYTSAARYAYAYLFFGDRTPGERAFADRQTQVRDDYNYALERVATLLFRRARLRGITAPPRPGDTFAIDGWQLTYGRIDFSLPRGARQLQQMLPAARLHIAGLRNTYRRDGLGAELVMVAKPEPPARGAAPAALADTGYLPATVLLRFPGDKRAAVLDGHRASIEVIDPYRSDQLEIRGQRVPLAANFSAPYALWLAGAGFGRQAIENLLGRSQTLEKPRVFLMQPYDPQREVVVMIHGLASSPEAWVNLANEVIGDADLRRHYQIWEVYYPTNVPIPVSVVGIRKALSDTFATLDPAGTAPASHHITLIGHSMGGVIARLLLVNSGDTLWTGMFKAPKSSARRRRLAMLAPYLSLKPFPGVDSAIFLASPHAGTPLAGHWLARLASGLIRLPKTLIEQAGKVADVLAGELPDRAGMFRQVPNGVDLLRDTDPYLRATSKLPIAPGIGYHSIIARRDPDGPLAASTDGLVPYASAHLAAAASEKIIVSGHSVQETPQAILEIRRILREHADPAAEPQPSSRP